MVKPIVTVLLIMGIAILGTTIIFIFVNDFFITYDTSDKILEDYSNTIPTIEYDQIDFTKINFSNWEYFRSHSGDVFYNPMECAFYRTGGGGESRNCNENKIGFIPVEYYPHKTLDDKLWKWYLLMNNKICPDNRLGVKNPLDGKLDCYPIENVPLKADVKIFESSEYNKNLFDDISKETSKFFIDGEETLCYYKKDAEDWKVLYCEIKN